MDEIIITLRNDKIRRIYRAATPEELAEDQRIRAAIAAELPELRRLGRERLAPLTICVIGVIFDQSELFE